MSEYQMAGERLEHEIDYRTSWGRNQIKELMMKILISVQSEIIRKQNENGQEIIR